MQSDKPRAQFAFEEEIKKISLEVFEHLKLTKFINTVGQIWVNFLEKLVKMVLLLSTIPSKTQDPSKIFKDSLSSQSAETLPRIQSCSDWWRLRSKEVPNYNDPNVWD